MLEFLRVSSLVLHFSCYTLMTFLKILSVLLPSMLMLILLSTVNVIRHLICSNSQNLLLRVNLIHKTLLTGAGSDLLISILEKLSFFCLASLIALVLLMWKWMGLFSKKNHFLICWCWISFPNWIGALAGFFC